MSPPPHGKKQSALRRMIFTRGSGTLTRALGGSRTAKEEERSMAPEEEAFALKCGREDRNMEYRHDWQDMKEAGWRYKTGPYGGYYRTYREDDE